MKKAKDTQDITKLNAILELVPEDRKPIAENLIKEIRFMAATLDQLREKVVEVGAVEQFINGKQKFIRENPALKSYNTTIQRYSLLYKQLTDLLPKGAQVATGSELMDFVCQG